jgi:hypothetical protein
MKDHIDREKLRIARNASAKIPDLLEYGSEEDFVAAVKVWKPNIAPAELKELILLFREMHREKRGL